MSTDGGSTKLMVTANTGRVVRVPINTVWVSEIVVRPAGGATGE